MAKMVKEGVNLTNKDAVDLLVEFSFFKDRVEKKFKELSKEFNGRNNEHDLWVTLYLVATDYSDEVVSKRRKDDCYLNPAGHNGGHNINHTNNVIQKIGLN